MDSESDEPTNTSASGTPGDPYPPPTAKKGTKSRHRTLAAQFKSNWRPSKSQILSGHNLQALVEDELHTATDNIRPSLMKPGSSVTYNRSHIWALESSKATLFLRQAIRTGSADQVTKYIEDGGNVNSFPRLLNSTPLCYAIRHGTPEIVKLLLQNGADVNAQDETEELSSPLALAALKSPQMTEILVKAGADVNMELSDGLYDCALIASVVEKSLESMRILIDAGADVNMQLAQGSYGSALAASARAGSTESMRILIDAGADVNMQLVRGRYGSALTASVVRESTEFMRILIDAGADVNMQLARGDYSSALVASAVRGRTESMRILIDAGADVNMQLAWEDYSSALVASVVAGRTESMRILIDAGADVNMQLAQGRYGSPLAASVATGDNVRTKILLDAGADVNMQLINGDFGSALSHCNSSYPVLRLLLAAGANVNLDLTHGCFGNALSAALYTNRHTVSDLVEAGATVGPLSSVMIKGQKRSHNVIKHTFSWELPGMVGKDDPMSYLSDMGTLTRGKDTVELAVGHDFLRESYGNWGISLLQGIARALKSSLKYYHDDNLCIETQETEILLMTTDATPDVRPMLEWICLTFRKPKLGALCVSKLVRSLTTSRLENLALFNLSGDGMCWHNLFESGVIAFRLPSHQTDPCRGLQLDFNRLVGLAAVEYPVLVESGLILMGYSTALIPIEATKDGRIMWHLEVAKDECQLQISDLEATKKQWLREISLENLQCKPAILGWCSEADVLLGTERLKPKVRLSNSSVKPVTWRWGGANLQFVAQSASPMALGGQLGFTFDRCINTISFAPSDNYVKCLRNGAMQHIVLYDVASKRAWLVPLISVFHHMLLNWSEQARGATRKAPPPLALPSCDSGRASLDALSDQGALILDGSGSDATTVRDLIMGFSVNLAKARLQAPKRSEIYGYEFMDIALESPTSELKKAKLEKGGLGWTPFLDEAKCLFCAHLGDAIIGNRSSLPQSPCNSLIEGYDLMAVSIQSINVLSKKYADSDDGSFRRLSQSHFWRLAGSPFQSCQHDNQGSCWARPEAFGDILQKINSQKIPEHSNPSPSNFCQNGALVFGKEVRPTMFSTVYSRPRTTPSFCQDQVALERRNIPKEQEPTGADRLIFGVNR